MISQITQEIVIKKKRIIVANEASMAAIRNCGRACYKKLCKNTLQVLNEKLKWG